MTTPMKQRHVSIYGSGTSMNKHALGSQSYATSKTHGSLATKQANPAAASYQTQDHAGKQTDNEVKGQREKIHESGKSSVKAGLGSATLALPAKATLAYIKFRKKKRRKGTTRYSNYDADGAMPLDFEEWFAMLPWRIRDHYPVTTTRQWFDTAERITTPNNPEHLSMNDFFLWTLTAAAAAHGAISLEEAFNKFDSEPGYAKHGGRVSHQGVAVVCKAMNFGSHSDAIIYSLDKDNSGEISLEELQQAVENEGCFDIALVAKRFLIALAWTSVHHLGRSRKHALQEAAICWRITGHDLPSLLALKEAEAEVARRTAAVPRRGSSASYLEIQAARCAEVDATRAAEKAKHAHRAANVAKVREEVQAHLANSPFMVADLTTLILDVEGEVEETKLDVMQFHEAIKERFRYVSTPWLLDDVFKAVDVDGNQVVGIDELWDWLRGKRYPLDRRIDRRAQRARDLALEPPAGLTLEMIAWDPPTLQHAIWHNLDRAHVSTIDLCRLFANLSTHKGTPVLLKLEFVVEPHTMLQRPSLELNAQHALRAGHVWCGAGLWR